MAEMLQVSLPEAGEIIEYRFSQDVPVKFNFFVSEVLVSCQGDDLVLTAENGGALVIKDYQTMAEAGTLPDFLLYGGEAVPGDIYLFAFSGAGLDVETAAGTEEEMGAGAEEPQRFDSVPGTEEEHDGADLQDHSSLMSPSIEEALEIGAILHDAEAAPLHGITSFRAEVESGRGSLADGRDSIAEILQHIIDSPDHC